MMPNKTIYVKDEDLPLFEKMRADSESSISSRFASFLRFEESIRNHRPVIEIMPEPTTLRDQFAMAAIIADSIQSAIVAAAYIAQGKRFDGSFPGPETHAAEYYKTADAILKARETIWWAIDQRQREA